MRICGQRYNFTDNSLWNNIGFFCKPLDNKLFVLFICNQINNHEKKERKVRAYSTAYRSIRSSNCRKICDSSTRRSDTTSRVPKARCPHRKLSKMYITPTKRNRLEAQFYCLNTMTLGFKPAEKEYFFLPFLSKQ